MELRALRAFVEVAKSGGFTLAAERLFVTQPTISKLIGKLESELGHPLLHRGRKQCELTDYGRAVLVYAESILRNLADIERALDDVAGLKRGELRIGIPPLGPRLFVPLIGAFKRRYPDIELKLFEDGSYAIEMALADGQLEMGVLLAPVDSQRYGHRLLLDDRLALVAPARSYWTRRRDEVGLAELAEEPFILFTPAYVLNDRIAEACRQCGFVPNVAGRSGQIGMILEMVRNGLGISLLPSSQLGMMDLRDFTVRRLVEPEIPWRIELAWLRGHYLSTAARAWLAMLDDDA